MEKPYFIAEIGVNFYDTAKEFDISLIDAAKLYIDEAVSTGVDCVKFQSYKADTIVSKNSPAYWDINKEPTRTQYELFLKHDKFGKNEYKILSEYAHSKGIDFTSTPFDYESVDYLDSMVDFFKISSSDITNLPFIAYIAKKGKPVVMSVGASYISEIEEAVRVLQNNQCNDIALLHCVLSYPTKEEDANLNFIKSLKCFFPNLKIGYSDHVAPDETMTIITAAGLLGAKIVEKHLTLNKNLQGNDHYHAGDPNDFKVAISNFILLEKVLGATDKTVLDCEFVARKEARRSLVLNRSMKTGETIEKGDIMPKRPGTGISPKYTNLVLGRKVKSDLPNDTILTWDMI